MKIEQHYPDRKSLAMAEDIYKEALLVLNKLYMLPPAEGERTLDTKYVIDYYIMSCVHTIVDMLTDGVLSFPSIFNYCMRNTYIQTSSDSMNFNNFYVNADYEHAALFGAVYYVLARQQKIDHEYLDYIEQIFTNNNKLKCYFLPFKEAAEKRNAEEDETKEKGKKDETKKLTPAQAGLFCEAFLKFRHCTYTNKKDTIAPIASSMFGWAVTTMERNLIYTKDDREYVAKIFEAVDPEFSLFVKNYGNASANQTQDGESEKDAG